LFYLLTIFREVFFPLLRTKKIIIKSLNWVELFFGFGLIGLVACSSNTATENEGEEEVTEEEQAPADEATTMSGENYTISVLESGIPSPRKEMKGTIEGVEVTVNYGSPSVKGRTIWGDLVPYDEVWRTGANKASSITFSSDVMINGQKLGAGTYGIFTVPGESEWVVIFNNNSDMWGSGDYTEDQDALRVTVQPEMQENSQEAMEFVVEGNQVVIMWDKVAVPFTVAPA
jgi:hypothetical protein